MMGAVLDIKDLQLNALLEITQAVNNNLSEEDLLKIYRFTLLADLKVNKLALFTEENKAWICRAHFGTTSDFVHNALPIEFTSLKSEVTLDDDQGSEFEIAFPVHHKSKLLAVVFLTHGSKDENQNRFLNALTNIILVAIENKKLARKQIEQEAYRKELEIAKKVQNFLFPKELPKIEQLQIEAFYLPHHDVGGDYYDYIPIDDDRFLVCIADVSGKGIPAALLMSNFQASLRALVRRIEDLKELVQELNRIIYISGNAENFITFFAAIYDFRKKELEFINCGHNEILLKSANGIIELNDGTTILGMLFPLPFIESKSLTNLTDFFLFAYTDGLTETFNELGQQFGFQRLKSKIEKSEQKNLFKLHESIINELNEFKGERAFNDDITMLSCSVHNI